MVLLCLFDFSILFCFIFFILREDILKKLLQKPKTSSESPQVPPKKQEPSRIPVVEPPKPSLPKPVPPPPPTKAPLPPKLDPPAKPPRSPSPHPLRVDAFEDIEYEEDESEEDDDSVIHFLPERKPAANTVNDFINVEIDTQQRDLSARTR